MSQSVSESSRDPITSGDLTTHLDKTANLSQTYSSETETIPSDYQVFEGNDFIDSENMILQQFSSSQHTGEEKNIYLAAAELPTLQLPDPEGSLGPQPFEPSWQKAVNKFFREQIKDHLIKKNKETGNHQTEASLEEQVQMLWQATLAGETAHLKAEDKQTIEIATKQTQAAWNLPESWSLGTREVKDWTPIENNPVPPVNIELARREVFAINIEELLNALDRVNKKMTDALPPQSIANFIKVIAQAIRDLKQVLRDLQIKEAEHSDALSRIKFEQIQDRLKQIEESNRKSDEAAEARRKQEKISNIMKKWVAPIISGLIIAIGIIALPFTAGMSMGLVIAGLAVASIMLTYTVLDATLDLTSKAVNAFQTFLDKTFPGEGNAWKTVFKIAILAALVTILVIAVAVSGGSAAGSIGSTIVSQVIKQAVIETISQVAIQFSLMAIMASNILPELCVNLLIKTGVINQNDEKAKMIAQMIIMALTTLVVLKVVSMGNNIRQVGTSIKESIQSIGLTLRNIGESITNMMQSIKAGVKASIESAIRQIQEMINQLIRMLRQAATAFPEYLTTLRESLAQAQNTAKQLKEFLSSRAFLEAIKSVPGRISNSAKAALEQLSLLSDQFKAASQELMDQLNQITKQLNAQARASLNRSLDNATKAINEALKDFQVNAKNYFTRLPEDLKQPFKDFWQGLKTFDPRTSPDQIARNIQDSLGILKLGTEVGMGIYIGYIGLQIERLYRQIGEMEKAEEIIQALIQLFDRLLESLQEGMAQRSEWLSSLDNALDSVYASATRSLNKASQVAA